jgi:hypothetical protein
VSYDKQLTRMARAGVPAVLMYGKWWSLEGWTYFAVQYNRKAPGKSQVVRVRVPGG